MDLCYLLFNPKPFFKDLNAREDMLTGIPLRCIKRVLSSFAYIDFSSFLYMERKPFLRCDCFCIPSIG